VRNFNFLIDLPVRSEWANVELLRISILNCFTVIFADLQGCHTFAMIAGELLENAIKYGQWDKAEPLLRLRVWGEPHHVSIEVENPIGDGSQPAVQELTRTLEWLDGFSDRESAYRARLLDIAASPREQGRKSRLGLARIAYEGNCNVSAQIMGDTVRVTAMMEL